MLELVDVHKRYGNVVALDGLQLRAAPGRILGFLGMNGAGKTTAMRTVFALVSPDRGEARWNGRPIDDDARRKFGYMPEQRGLYPRIPVQEQLVYFGRLHGMDLGPATRSARRLLDELALNHRAKDRLDALSHGNQQRIQLAVALVHDPQLLVLDEPFSGLDPVGVATMAAVLRERAANGAAIVFSSHQLELVEDLCDDVLIINNGRDVRSGGLTEMRESTGRRVVEARFDPDGKLAAPTLFGVDPTRTNDTWRWVVPANVSAEDALKELTRVAPTKSFTYRPPSLQEVFREVVTP